MNKRGAISLHLVLTIFLGLGMVLFGVLAIMAYSDNQYVRSNLNTLVAQGKKQGADQQKQSDAEAYQKAGEEPYRTYTAQSVDGGFSLQIPKNWSLVAQHGTSQTQLNLMADPDVVDASLSGGAEAHALRLQLLRRPTSEALSSYEAKVKKKTLTSKQVTVSGVNGYQYTGAIDDQHTSGIIIVLPVRDKTMTISVENSRYQDQFAKIIATAKINP